jgi:hypothetical protein
MNAIWYENWLPSSPSNLLACADIVRLFCRKRMTWDLWPKISRKVLKCFAIYKNASSRTEYIKTQSPYRILHVYLQGSPLIWNRKYTFCCHIVAFTVFGWRYQTLHVLVIISGMDVRWAPVSLCYAKFRENPTVLKLDAVNLYSWHMHH